MGSAVQHLFLQRGICPNSIVPQNFDSVMLRRGNTPKFLQCIVILVGVCGTLSRPGLLLGTSASYDNGSVTDFSRNPSSLSRKSTNVSFALIILSRMTYVGYPRHYTAQPTLADFMLLCAVYPFL